MARGRDKEPWLELGEQQTFFFIPSRWRAIPGSTGQPLEARCSALPYL